MLDWFVGFVVRFGRAGEGVKGGEGGVVGDEVEAVEKGVVCLEMDESAWRYS